MRSPRARCATTSPMRPRPIRPRVLPVISTPLNLDRSHLPALSEACACGSWRAWASIRAMACSPAATAFDSGAFATRMPRLVAAATSMLSTPLPARPITLSRLLFSSMSAVTCVCERTIKASYSLIRDVNSSSRLPCVLLEEHSLRRCHAFAQRDGLPQLVHRHLQGRDGDDDVKGAKVAQVPHADDLAPKFALPAGKLYPVLILEQDVELLTVQARRHTDRSHRACLGVVPREELEPQSLGGFPGRPAQYAVALEELFQPLLANVVERESERLNHPHGGSPGHLRPGVLQSLLGVLERKVEHWAARLAGPLPGGLANADEGQPRRRHQRLLRARHSNR